MTNSNKEEKNTQVESAVEELIGHSGFETEKEEREYYTKTLQDIDKKAREEVLDSIEHRTTKCECCNGFEERFNSLKEDVAVLKDINGLN